MRVNIREGYKVSTRPAPVGMRSRASGAARLHACFCCFCERALALSELTRCPPSSDVQCRIVQEHVRPKSHGRETRSRASRRRLSDNNIRCSAFDRGWFPARPAQHVHRRRNNRKGPIHSALASARGRNGKGRVETCYTGRAGAHRPSEALHAKRSSDRAAADRAGARPLRHTLPKRVEMLIAGSQRPYHSPSGANLYPSLC